MQIDWDVVDDLVGDGWSEDDARAFAQNREEPPWCDCGHSLYDHAVRAGRPAGTCFVGGCGCSRFHAGGEPATPRGAA